MIVSLVLQATRKLHTVPAVLRSDRDAKYTESFDAVFKADDIQVMRTAPQAPRMNAHCERVIGTLRREALDHLLIWNETHARQVLATPSITTVIAPIRLAGSSLPSSRSTRRPWSTPPLTGFCVPEDSVA
ncbi:hypothetical protein ACIQPP_50815 [Streptomyces violaceusniger]|uniref:hypothetical protein n=1 Tax=Streptomyces violaceusniger TaxID=68280 RepID=UPI0009C29846|nr:integrase [Streptomyces hygroscopicus]